MAHEVINGKVVVDWTTGDPEGDRLTLLAAYRDFIKEVSKKMESDRGEYNLSWDLKDIFNKWSIDTENQIDNIPRVWIKRPV